MNTIFDKQLYDLLGPNKIKKDEPMRAHTTFRIGGPADYFATPGTTEEIQRTIGLCKEHAIPFYILGNGSNLLVGDYGFRGVMIKLGQEMEEITFHEDGTVTALTGVMLSKLAAEIAERELTGFEFASGIPGTLGGAISMNAGAYGGEIKDVIASCTIIDADGNLKELTKEEMQFSYRKSIIQEKGYIVVSGTFCFEKGKKEEILRKMNELNTSRREKQPLSFPSAGSTFKRPEGHFAGKLIEDTGLRGFSVGDAMVSEKHCGFVINAGNATAAEVKELMAQVDERVFAKFSVHLEPEVRMIGEF